MVWRQAGFLANLPTHATRASRSPRFRPCSLKYAKITPVLQATKDITQCTQCNTSEMDMSHNIFVAMILMTGLLVGCGKKSQISRDFHGQIRGKKADFVGISREFSRPVSLKNDW